MTEALVDQLIRMEGWRCKAFKIESWLLMVDLGHTVSYRSSNYHRRLAVGQVVAKGPMAH